MLFLYLSEFFEDLSVLIGLLVTFSFVIGCDFRSELLVETVQPFISLDFGLEWCLKLYR
jgi:hypothetical protein